MSSLNNKNLNDLSSSLITNIPTLSTSGPVIGGTEGETSIPLLVHPSKIVFSPILF